MASSNVSRLARLRAEVWAHRSAYAWCCLSGALYAAGFCGFDQYVLAWICLVPALAALDQPTLSPGVMMRLAWTTGLVAHLGCYSWIIYMLRYFAYLPLPLALLGYSLLCLAQSSLFAAWGWLMGELRARAGLRVCVTAPVCMVLAEWLYPALFPSYLANSQYRQPIILQSLELWGPLGLTGVLVLCSCASTVLLSALWQRRRLQMQEWALVASFVFVGGGNLAYGKMRLAQVDAEVAAATQRIKVGLVQTNMGIYEKSENPIEGLRRHRDQSLELESQGAQLIIWPESGYYFGIPSDTRELKKDVLGPVQTPVLFGGLRVERSPQGRRLYNTAFLTNGQGTLLGTYDKIYLLTFGEYLPFGELLPFLYSLSPQTSHFSRGTHTEPLLLDGVRYGLMICYEDILPAFVRKVASHNPEVLVNLTNDAWFGDSYEPQIHLALGLFRAIEHRRYLVRATNTGISSIIEPTGRMTHHSPVFQRANILGEVSPRHGTTFYGRHGDLVGYASLLLLAFWLLWARLSPAVKP